ncbi:uncharacterized protein LOC134538471 [Bacillus rossius redtenbacheri]|uniref:uncharacterized protein LOC134538471 n=1 Tax=Bacillus rossius redtenbacheri TaxID=93214 RepID=UPI002FDCE9B2
MNDEQLIELVCGNTVLYDLSNPKYMDTEFKNTLWTKIGAEMNTTGPLCKTRWGNIRDNFRKSLKKNKTVSGQNSKNVKLYKYSEQLSFLKHYFQERETRSNIYAAASNEDLRGEVDVDESISCHHDEGAEDQTMEANTSVTVQSQSHTWTNPKPTGSIQSVIPRKKTKQSLPNTATPKTAAATVMEYLIKKNESGNCSSPPLQHPVDAFLCGIAPALKKLPPHYWHYAKSDIFAAVQKYEFKLLLDQQQVPQSSGSSHGSNPTFPEQPSPAGSSHHSSLASAYQTSTPSTDEAQPATPVNFSLQEYYQSYSE